MGNRTPAYKSQLDQLYSDGLSSKITPDVAGDEAQMAATRERKNNTRSYKNALRATRSNDAKERAYGFKMVADLQADPSFQVPKAIPTAGEYDQQDRSTGQERIELGLQAKRKQAAESGQQVADEIALGASNFSQSKGATEWDKDASGVPDLIQRNSPVASPATTTAPSGPTGVTTHPAPAAPSANGQPVVKPSWRDDLGLDSREKFAQDLSTSKLIEDQDAGAVERAYTRGKQLGVSKEQVNQYLGMSSAAATPDIAAVKADEKIGRAIANLDPEKFSPEMIAQIRANMAKASPQERKEFAAKGEKAGIAYGQKTDDVLARARKTLDEVKSGIAQKQVDATDLRSRINKEAENFGIGKDLTNPPDVPSADLTENTALRTHPVTIKEDSLLPSNVMDENFFDTNPNTKNFSMANPFGGGDPLVAPSQMDSNTPRDITDSSVKDNGKGFFRSLASDIGNAIQPFIDDANPFSDINKERGTKSEEQRRQAELGMFASRLAENEKSLTISENDYASASSQTGKSLSRSSIDRQKQALQSQQDDIIDRHLRGEVDASSLFEKNPRLKERFDQRAKQKSESLAALNQSHQRSSAISGAIASP
jgi:hypothetical protein